MNHAEHTAPEPSYLGSADPTFDQIVAGYYETPAHESSDVPSAGIHNLQETHDPYLQHNNDPRVSVGLEVGKKLLPGQVVEVNYDMVHENMRRVEIDPGQDHSSIRVRFGDVRLSGSNRARGYYTPAGEPGYNIAERPDFGRIGDYQRPLVKMMTAEAQTHPRIGVIFEESVQAVDTQGLLGHELAHRKQDMDGKAMVPHYEVPSNNNPSVWRKIAGGSWAANYAAFMGIAINHIAGNLTNSGYMVPAVNNAITRVVEHYYTAGPLVGALPLATVAAAYLYRAKTKPGATITEQYYNDPIEKEAFKAQERVKGLPSVLEVHTPHLNK